MVELVRSLQQCGGSRHILSLFCPWISSNSLTNCGERRVSCLAFFFGDEDLVFCPRTRTVSLETNLFRACLRQNLENMVLAAILQIDSFNVHGVSSQRAAWFSRLKRNALCDGGRGTQ